MDRRRHKAGIEERNSKNNSDEEMTLIPVIVMVTVEKWEEERMKGWKGQKKEDNDIEKR